MTKYAITAPDGKEIEVETDLKMTDRLAKEVLKDAGYSFNKKSKKFDAEKIWEGSVGVASNLDEGTFFGLGKRALSGAMAAGAWPVDRVAEAMGVENTPSFADRYNQYVDYVDNARKNINASSPLTGLGLETYAMLKNPLYKGGAKIIDEAPTLGKKVIAGGMVNAGLAGTDDILRGNEEKAEDDALAYGVAGTITPLGGRAVEAVLRNAGKLAPSVRRIGKAVDETQLDERINNLVNKYGEGFGDKEAIGNAARKPISDAIEKIEDVRDRLYKEAWSLTDKMAPAELSNTVSTIEESLPHLTRGSQQKLLEFMRKEVLPKVYKTQKGLKIKRITTEQLDGARSKFGEFVGDTGLGKAKTEKNIIDKLYFAMKEDFLNSVAKNGAGQRARDAMEDAMNNYKNLLENRSDLKLLKELSKDKNGASSIADQVLGALSSNKADTQKLKRLARADKEDKVKRAVAGYINNSTKFNKLSPEGKKFVYGEGVGEAEKAFNETAGKKINSILNTLADKNKANSPYINALIRYLFNN